MKQLIYNCLKNNHMFNVGYIKQILFKQPCLLCASNIDAQKNSNALIDCDAICESCLNDLPWHPTNSCPQCGLELSDSGLNRTVCGSCINTPPNFDATYAV